MATQLDLQEQEQLDSLKAFWKRNGNLVSWLLIVLLAAYAGWNGWNYWQRDQGFKAGALFEELDRAVAAGDADRVQRAFGDLQSRYPKTAFAQQAALLAAQSQLDKGKPEAAKASLQWLASQGTQDELRTIARLRLAALLGEAKEYDAALKQLEGINIPGFEALAADRRGDLLLAQGKPAEALVAYQAAYAAMDDKVDYKRVLEAKLTALGAPPAPPAAASAPGAAS